MAASYIIVQYYTNKCRLIVYGVVKWKRIAYIVL